MWQEEDSELDGIDCTHIKDIQMDHGVACLAWSPKTSISILDKQLWLV